MKDRIRKEDNFKRMAIKNEILKRYSDKNIVDIILFNEWGFEKGVGLLFKIEGKYYSFFLVDEREESLISLVDKIIKGFEVDYEKVVICKKNDDFFIAKQLLYIKLLGGDMIKTELDKYKGESIVRKAKNLLKDKDGILDEVLDEIQRLNRMVIRINN